MTVIYAKGASAVYGAVEILAAVEQDTWADAL
jgi:hypothetical protein